MSVNIKKGERINLAKESPGLEKVGMGLGWDINATDTGVDFDLDASVFMLASNGKIPQDEYFVFYNNLNSPDGSVRHLGDNRTGSGSGDDEVVEIDLTQVNSAIEELIFVVTIHDADQRRQNFGQVRNSYIRIYDQQTNTEIAKYDLEEDFSRETAVEFGRLYNKNGEWRFHAVGQGYNEGLQSFVDKYV
ncbi:MULTISPECIES: TerD family protein [Arthrospira]|jgi:tellurium resistance protein TerD|uniref:Tellurium resistance protein n=1 Tax=Limnospira platensis NIES-46 TaxID=1236695 RepID=A0A5M3TB47_LIMPL|nr:MULTISPECIES: TerD family protein [Arthrospira]AMW27113.1 chemical-damaging agent resistance protein C [Arthrospira platensis YZ]KDR55385.1 chemical-damaging agent resistance protein C [Arthrospira platensis str. Paraca]MBD2670324.1 TerD family protein [Arthrospira platensis FACHB-439]MBD2710936.1 TerD family protein [Arthrospira platensis FACHB-835]MDF2211415.1 TerD family protein [Arthrospira platensis NCB002]MDT9183432.1 TerD family protein [Limnospira sp. PMC 289.06]MDT9295490.1 TerD 